MCSIFYRFSLYFPLFEICLEDANKMPLIIYPDIESKSMCISLNHLPLHRVLPTVFSPIKSTALCEC